MRTREALALAVVLLAGAVAIVLLSLQGSGGMMGGMGGMMGGMALAGVLSFVAIAVLVVSLAARSAIPYPTPPMPMPPPPAPAPLEPPPNPAATSPSAVEAAVVKLLDEDERLLYTRLRDSGGTVLQKDIVAWGTFSAAKVTRLLDRLEGKGLVVRERHGMTNRIRLLHR